MLLLGCVVRSVTTSVTRRGYQLTMAGLGRRNLHRTAAPAASACVPAVDLRIYPALGSGDAAASAWHSVAFNTGAKPGACVSRGGLVTAPPASMTSYPARLYGGAPAVCMRPHLCSLPVRMTELVTALERRSLRRTCTASAASHSAHCSGRNQR